MGYYLAIKKNEVLIYVTTWVGLENVTQNERNQTQKTHMLYDSIHRKCPGMTNT